ncbi:MAG: hypothetical protein QM305_06600, partial [Bacteroidota bacterium]|nr:hypothetical protein [Bacteroidota bacterium]
MAFAFRTHWGATIGAIRDSFHDIMFAPGWAARTHFLHRFMTQRTIPIFIKILIFTNDKTQVTSVSCHIIP